MNATAQQIQSDPARRFADKILARTNNGRDVIDLLHDISNGAHNANKNDRITAAKYLVERGYGKCPKLPPAADPDPTPETGDTDAETPPESPSPASHGGPESPRLVTQVTDALNDSLGPAPSAHSSPQSTQPSDPFSIQSSIQDYIIEITNDGDTLIDTLIEIAYAGDDDPTVTSYHRTRAGRILGDHALGTDPNTLRNAVCPGCRQSWTTHTCSPVHPERSAAESKDEEEPIDKEAWDRVIAELKELEKRYNLDPNRTIPRNKYSYYLPPEDYVIPPEVAAEEAAKFRAEIALRAERRKNWPKIEERRRKKLAQIYPSHSEEEEDEPPDT